VASFIIAITDTQVVVLPCGWFKRNKPSRSGPGTCGHPAWSSGHIDRPTFALGNLVLETDEEYVSVMHTGR
jgi:hypothetical protein